MALAALEKCRDFEHPLSSAQGYFRPDDNGKKPAGFRPLRWRTNLDSGAAFQVGTPCFEFPGAFEGKRGIEVGKASDFGLNQAAIHLENRPFGSRFRIMVIFLSGQIFASILAALVLWLTLAGAGYTGLWAYIGTSALIAVRVWYFHTRGPKPVLLHYRTRKKVWRTLVDEGHMSLILLAFGFVLGWPIDRLTALIFVVCNIILQLCLMSLSRLLINQLTSRDRLGGQNGSALQQALIVGTGTHALKVADMVLDTPELRTRLIGFLDYRRKDFWRYHDIPLMGHPDSLKEIVANTQVDALFWAVEQEDVAASAEMLDTAEKMGVSVFVMPSLYDPRVAKVRPTYINGLPAMVYRSIPENHAKLLTKNIIDRLGALLGVILSLPIMLITALLIKLESRGPVFFKQVRSGLNGRPFNLYKFRTMCSDAEKKKERLLEQNEMSGPVFKIKEDPRVTRVGRILRKYSIDELPQFFNILRGEMSLVGPRPPLPKEVSQYEPWQHRKLSVRPGLTCLWQVNGRNEIDFDEWMRLDLRYIDNWSLWLDTKILAKTLPAVMKGSGR